MLSFLVVLMATGGFCSGRELNGCCVLRASFTGVHTHTDRRSQGYILTENDKFNMYWQVVLFESMSYMLC